ncbi:hypothetical protein O181_014104 [Austropuccinia psidii MF-1]|uniref:Large ribosomal subunit protein uL23m n=1 Tax=Austropuccinia psidii MF-1 TaxID=1389203 RepID=A0A9Q3BXK0_9BASI|nr:hypothetical protein [Austropuccinia psidii MF-1]
MSSKISVGKTLLAALKHRSSSSSVALRRLATASEGHAGAPASPPNETVRNALKKLPRRPLRLDHHSTEPSQKDVLIRSLNNGRSPIGSAYAKAQDPVHFPNLSIRLVRPSATDRGDPFTAIFRCDLRLTKPDIFNYLRQIYGLGITSIRTAIYRGRFQRQLKSKVRGGITIARDKTRTFKKVWVGLDRPFFYPSRPSEKWLDEQYMYSDLINSYHRARLTALQQGKTDRNQVLPSGPVDKGERSNVLRSIIDSKKQIHDELQDHVKKSLMESKARSRKTHS